MPGENFLLSPSNVSSILLNIKSDPASALVLWCPSPLNRVIEAATDRPTRGLDTLKFVVQRSFVVFHLLLGLLPGTKETHTGAENRYRPLGSRPCGFSGVSRSPGVSASNETRRFPSLCVLFPPKPCRFHPNLSMLLRPLSARDRKHAATVIFVQG